MKFALEHFCEPLMDDPSYFSKRMFGGLAVYHSDLMRFILTEMNGKQEWRGQKYNFELWNGVLLCTSSEHHGSLQKQWSQLVNHPVLGKWLFLPMNDPDFEMVFQELIEAAKENDSRIGIVPGSRKKGKPSLRVQAEKMFEAVAKKNRRTFHRFIDKTLPFKAQLPGPVNIHSAKQFLESQDPWFQSKVGEFKYQISVAEKLNDDEGFTVAQVEYSNVDEKGKPFTKNIEITMIYQLRDRQWCLVENYNQVLS